MVHYNMYYYIHTLPGQQNQTTDQLVNHLTDEFTHQTTNRAEISFTNDSTNNEFTSHHSTNELNYQKST